MKILGFRTVKPRPFNYNPLYYDRKKEKIEELKKRISGEKTEGGISPDFREKLKSSWRIQEKRTGNISKITLLLYLGLAALFIYYIFFS